MIAGDRQADRDLAVILLAQLATILPRHADRVLAFLQHARVVDDQGPDRAALLDDGQDTGTHCREHRVAGPLSLRHQVMQRLVRCRPRPGCRREAIGSTLLRSPGSSIPAQYDRKGVA